MIAAIPTDLREVPLTRGYIALVDAADYDLVATRPWYARPHRRTVYGVWNDPGPPRFSQQLHRFLLGLRPHDPQVDHIDGNGLHCWRANLRIATPLQNAMNKQRPKLTAMSRFKGVDWRAPKRLWRARIARGGKSTYLGMFKDEIQAALAYDAAAREMFGEFACLNFPREGERSALAG